MFDGEPTRDRNVYRETSRGGDTSWGGMDADGKKGVSNPVFSALHGLFFFLGASGTECGVRTGWVVDVVDDFVAAELDWRAVYPLSRDKSNSSNGCQTLT